MGTEYQIYLLKWTLSGILEPRLKISRPAKVAPIELLMSVNEDSFFCFGKACSRPMVAEVLYHILFLLFLLYIELFPFLNLISIN